MALTAEGGSWYIPDMMITLYHVTPRWNMGSILRRGILASLARGKKKRVWLVPAQLLEWARNHVMDRHRCGYDDVTVICVRVEVPFVRGGPHGTYWLPGNVTPARIVSAWG